MWVKRTDVEIAEERERRYRSKVRAAITVGLLVLVSGTCFFPSSIYLMEGRLLVPTSEYPSRLPFFLGLAIIIGVLWYYGTHTRPLMICPQCEITKYEDGVTNCACGGRFEKMETMKYVAEPDGTAKGNQPIRSETNQTPGVAGSRR